MDILRIEYDFKDNNIVSEKFNEIISLGTKIIELKLDIGDGRDIFLDESYKLHSKFFSRLKENGIAVSYKSLTFNIYPTMVCLTIPYKDLEAFELESLKTVKNIFRESILNKYIPSILKNLSR